MSPWAAGLNWPQCILYLCLTQKDQSVFRKRWSEELLVGGRITLHTRRWSLIFPADDPRLFPYVIVQRCHGNGKLAWAVWLEWWANFALHVGRKNALTFLDAESQTCASMLLYSAQCYSSLPCPALWSPVHLSYMLKSNDSLQVFSVRDMIQIWCLHIITVGHGHEAQDKIFSVESNLQWFLGVV